MRFEELWRIVAERHRWAWLGLLIGVLATYVLTLSPGVLGGDPGELQFVPYILSIPHPTGTPLYCLLGKVWSALPIGPTVAWRMNLLAAVSAALASVLVYQCVYLRHERPVPALAAALSLAFGLTFWEQALLADKYAFNALLVALVVYLALRWRQTRSSRTLDLLALVYGLSLTHHRTMALFAPVLLGYVWWHERGALLRDIRRLLRLALLCLAPLSLYLYLPWAAARGLPPGTWRPDTVREWYAYLSDTGYASQVRVDLPELRERLTFYARTLQHDFTWPGVLLGIGGLAWQVRRRTADAVFLLSNFGLQAFLAANYHVPRSWVFFIPSFVVYALWVGEGIAGMWIGVERLGQGWKGTRAVALTFLGMAMLTWSLAPFPARYRPLRQAHLGAGVLDAWRQTLKGGRAADRVGKAIAQVASNAVIVGDWEQATPLWYYQQVEGLRPDVQIVYPIDRLEEAASRGHLLYLARAVPGIADRWHPSAAGPLIALHAEPVYGLPGEVVSLGLELGKGGQPGEGVMRLSGSVYGEADYRPSTVLPLTLYWQAMPTPAHDYSVSLRVFGPDGGQVFQVDSQHPVMGTYPTSLWSPGEIVGDYYEIPLSPDTVPGTYRWGVILYRALPEGGWESLQVIPSGSEVAMGDTFTVWQRGNDRFDILSIP